MISIFIALSLKFFYLHHTSANSVCTSVVAKESTTQIRNSIEKDGRYLEAAIIETRLVPSVLSCSQKCLYIEECRTANFHKIAATDGLHQCELLQDAPGDNASQFNVLQDWIHLQFVIHEEPKSCLDYFNRGYTQNGCYRIISRYTEKSTTVYCDFASETGRAWTLIMSYSLQTNQGADGAPFKTITLMNDCPENAEQPNWGRYRLTKDLMISIESQSTHFRVTCSENGVFSGINNYRDYLRVSLQSFSPITYIGDGECEDVEHINIRGISCTNCQAPFWQYVKDFNLHTDSTFKICPPFNATQGAVQMEDNFGFYGIINSQFGCTKNSNSTTHMWFG